LEFVRLAGQMRLKQKNSIVSKTVTYLLHTYGTASTVSDCSHISHRAVPDVYQCISAAMESCNSCERDWAELNATLSFIFSNMSSECPVSCDVDAGYNCSNSYYFQVLWLLINDLPGYCTEIFK